MFERHDWITPTLGGHTWFEKPALLYWLEIVAFTFFGVSEWSARLGPALCGVLTFTAIWLLGRDVERNGTGDHGQFAASSLLLSASCLGLIAFSRGASFDIVITMTTTWALSFFLRYEIAPDQENRTRLLTGFYLFVGLSLLAKGLVGIVIPTGVLGTYFLLSRKFPTRQTWLSMMWGVPLALLVSVTWYGPVIYRHGWQFINEFFIQHHFARYLSNKYHHPQPLYFYPAILLMLSIPWTAFLVAELINGRKWRWRDGVTCDRMKVFSLAWIMFPVIFFSFSGSKLPGYILPVLPPALILISSSVVEQTGRWPIKATGVLCLVLGAAGLIYGLRVAHLPAFCTAMASTPFFVGGMLALLSNQTRLVIHTIAGAVCLSVVVLLNCGAANIVRRESTRDLLSMAAARGYANLRVLALPGDDRSAEFYASSRVVYGANGEVTPVYDVPEVVADARTRGERLLAFVDVQDLYLYRNRQGVEIIGDNGKLALICLY